MNEIYIPIAKIKGSIVAQLLIKIFGGIGVLTMFMVLMFSTFFDIGIENIENMESDEIVEMMLANETLMSAIGISILVIAVLYVLTYLFFIKGVQGAISSFDAIGRRALGMIRLSAVINVSFIGLSFLSVIGGAFFGETILSGALSVLLVIGSLVGLATLALNIMGYTELIKSTSLDEVGRRGAIQLLWGFAFSVITQMVYFIPYVGWLSSLVLFILSYVYLLKGWSKIQCSDISEQI